MKRKITSLEQRLIENGWILTIKRYWGKRSEKTRCYEYTKKSDIRNNGETYDQVIVLDKKRSQIVNYGIENLKINFLDRAELDLIRFLFLELRHFVERITIREPREIKPMLNKTSESDWEKWNGYNETNELPPMTPEQFDEMCQEMENENAKDD